VDALEAGFLARLPEPIGADGPRLVLDHGAGDLLLMPATGPEGAGAKIVSAVPANPGRGLPMINGLYVLFSRDTLVPEALIDGAGLTRLRTAAVSALVARLLAKPGSRRLVLFGAGPQAEGHAQMFHQIFPLEEITIVAGSATSPRAAALQESLRQQGLTVRIGNPADVADADLVCTCTTAAEPVFESALLAPGSHVTAVGSYKPTRREIDFELCRRALLVVESLEAAREEAGDLVQAIEAGVLPAEGFAHEIADLLRDDVEREDAAQISVFKSVGLPSEDLIVARAATEKLLGPPA
jgi:ornithine cyclodeaminase